MFKDVNIKQILKVMLVVLFCGIHAHGLRFS